MKKCTIYWINLLKIEPKAFYLHYILYLMSRKTFFYSYLWLLFKSVCTHNLIILIQESYFPYWFYMIIILMNISNRFLEFRFFFPLKDSVLGSFSSCVCLFCVFILLFKDVINNYRNYKIIKAINKEWYLKSINHRHWSLSEF